MPLHSSLTGSELHENKGVSTAADNTVASATSSATVWRKVNSNMLDTTSIFTTNVQVLQATLNVNSSAPVYISIPFACTVTKVTAVTAGAFPTNDAIATVKNAAGLSMGTMTLPFTGSAAGNCYTLTPGSNNTITAGSQMQIVMTTTNTTSTVVQFTVQVTVTA